MITYKNFDQLQDHLISALRQNPERIFQIISLLEQWLPDRKDAIQTLKESIKLPKKEETSELDFSPLNNPKHHLNKRVIFADNLTPKFELSVTESNFQFLIEHFLYHNAEDEMASKVKNILEKIGITEYDKKQIVRHQYDQEKLSIILIRLCNRYKKVRELLYVVVSIYENWKNIVQSLISEDSETFDYEVTDLELW
jgi:hypothetical protein